MGFDSSPEGAPLLLNSLFDSHMDEPHQLSSSSIFNLPVPSATVISQNGVQDQSSLITPPPELRLRAASPEPQQDPCQQASQSASQAIRQASQLASDSIRQASQQASQSADAASRSASEGIRQAQQSASQSIAQASRSVDSVVSSASSALSSISASAADAISKANEAQSRAQASASTAQVQASAAVLNAGAAVAAATGKAAAAGSSFLAAAASATESAQASIAAFGSAAASQINQASEQAKASQTTAITATQTAIAIVGSIIASALITILIYFLITRHKKKKKSKAKRERGEKSASSSPSPTAQFAADSKLPVSDQERSTVPNSQGAYAANGAKSNDPGRGTPTQASFSLYPRITSSEGPPKRSSLIKTTSVAWDPQNPPKPPSLGSWLKLQDGVSPFGPIKLPTDEEVKGPLGGQLKSPLQSTKNKPPSPLAPRFISSKNTKTKKETASQPSRLVPTTRTKSPGPPTPRFLPKTNNLNKSQTPQAESFTTRPPLRSPKIPVLTYHTPTLPLSTNPTNPLTPPSSRQDSIKRRPLSPITPQPQPQLQSQPQSIPGPEDKDLNTYRASKASVWTDEIPNSAISALASPLGTDASRAQPQIATQAYRMEIPAPRNPVRTTAEWARDQARQRDAPGKGKVNPFTSTLPRARYQPSGGEGKNGGGGKMGLPSQPGPQRMGTIRSVEGELGFVDEERQDDRGSGGRYTSPKSSIGTPGVGKAM